MTHRSVLVVTVVHDPEDSRIRHRQIRALLEAGWSVTYAAPFAAFGRPVTGGPQRLRLIDIPRSQGRRRMRALRAAHSIIAAEGPQHDVVLVHDPELLLTPAAQRSPHLVWDVHEDPAAAIAVKDWAPIALRRPLAFGWRLAERFVERRHHVILAEYAYQDRFRRRHPVVPNTVVVPDAPVGLGPDRMVYIGSVTLARGSRTLVATAERVHRATQGRVLLDVVGPAHDDESAELLRAGQAAGYLRWHGFLPSGEALAMLDGALCGLSLLRDLPNYRSSMPTKVVEYLGCGLPAVTTPLPLAADLVTRSQGGIVVPFDDAQAAADAVLDLRADIGSAQHMGRQGRATVRAELDWSLVSPTFVGALSAAADSAGRTR